MPSLRVLLSQRSVLIIRISGEFCFMFMLLNRRPMLPAFERSFHIYEFIAVSSAGKARHIISDECSSALQTHIQSHTTICRAYESRTYIYVDVCKSVLRNCKVGSRFDTLGSAFMQTSVLNRVFSLRYIHANSSWSDSATASYTIYVNAIF